MKDVLVQASVKMAHKDQITIKATMRNAGCLTVPMKTTDTVFVENGVQCVILDGT